MNEPTNIDDGGPAFPYTEESVHLGHNGEHIRCIEWQCPGMTKRDMFAMNASDGDIAIWIPDPDELWGEYCKKAKELGIPVTHLRCWAKYQHADAMIAASKGER